MLQPTFGSCRDLLEAEHNSGGHSEIVLALRARCTEFAEARQQVIDLRGTNREARIDAIVDPSAHSHCKCILAICCVEHVRPGMRNSEEHFSKRCHAPKVMIGNARTEKIRGKSAVHT